MDTLRRTRHLTRLLLVWFAHRRDLVAKHRYLVDESKLFKVDEGSISPLDSRAQDAIAEQILAAADGAAGVIFADFGYGLITAGLLDRIPRTPAFRMDGRWVSADLQCSCHRGTHVVTERRRRIEVQVDPRLR